jgi:hypothetical protein
MPIYSNRNHIKVFHSKIFITKQSQDTIKLNKKLRHLVFNKDS